MKPHCPIFFMKHTFFWHLLINEYYDFWWCQERQSGMSRPSPQSWYSCGMCSVGIYTPLPRTPHAPTTCCPSSHRRWAPAAATRWWWRSPWDSSPRWPWRVLGHFSLDNSSVLPDCDSDEYDCEHDYWAPTSACWQLPLSAWHQSFNLQSCNISNISNGQHFNSSDCNKSGVVSFSLRFSGDLKTENWPRKSMIIQSSLLVSVLWRPFLLV